jgi:plastocyanin
MKIPLIPRSALPALALAALAWSAPALAQNAAVQISIKDHRFQPAEVRVPAGKPITLQVRNLDPTPEEFESKTLRVEKVIPGNSEATIQLRALQPGRYKFFGEFNEKTAQGVLVAE